MGNLCSIYHANFGRLVTLTNSYNKAVFLDKCIFWWQISKYTLNDKKIWFTRTIPEMAKELSISERSVSRYLDEMEQQGFIERVCKLSASNKKGFQVTKRLYIHIPKKLLSLLSATKNLDLIDKAASKPEPSTDLKVNSTNDESECLVLSQKKDIYDKTIAAHNAPIEATSSSETNEKCFFSNQNGNIDNDNLSVSIYKDKDYNLVNNNTVSQPKVIANTKNISPLHLTYPIEELIGERLSDREKNYIKGMMANLKKQHGLFFSSPEQLFAEISFTVLNKSQLEGINAFNHRVHIISKLLREKRWLTPKGFYNHADFGVALKKPVGLNDNRLKNFSSLQHVPGSVYQIEKSIASHQNQLNVIHHNIATEQRYLNEITVYYKESRISSPALIDSITNTIHRLHLEKETVIQILKDLQSQLHALYVKGAQVNRHLQKISKEGHENNNNF